MVYAKVAQLVESVTSNDRLFYFWESGVRVPLCTYIFFFSILLFFVYFFFFDYCFFFHYFLLIIRRFF